MKWGVFCLLLVSLNQVYSQEYQKEFKTDQFNDCKAICTDDQYLYLGVGRNKNWDIETEDQYLYKLDYQLQLIDSVNMSAFFKPDTNQTIMLMDVEVDDWGFIYGLYLIHTYQTGATCLDRKSILIKHDDQLGVLDTIEIGEESLQEEFIDLEIQGDILVASGGAADCDSALYKPASFRLDLVTGTSRFNYYDTLGINETWEFLDPTIIGDKIIVAANLGISGSNQGALGTAVLDSNLNIEKLGSIRDYGVHPDHRQIRSSGAFVPVSSDSIWKLGTCETFFDTLLPPPLYNDLYWNFGASLLDSGYNVTILDTFPLSGFNYTTSYDLNGKLSASFEPADYNSVDSVVFVQGEKYIRFDNYGSQDSTAFWIYNFNARSGTMNWMKRIQRNYTIGGHSVAALPGNRWAISFNEYNWDKYSGPNLAVHVWILNDDGDIISEREFSKPPVELLVYPNPATNYLEIEGMPTANNKHSYKIYNEAGSEVHAGTFRPEEGRINVAFLSAGIYFIVVEGETRVGTARFQKM